MIGYLSGKIHRVNDNSVIVDVQGVGYEIFCPKTTLFTAGRQGDEAGFEVYTHVSENNIQLFGFLTAQEKAVFQKLLSASGIGPKMGLSILSDMPLDKLFKAIASEDVNALTQISGVGKKTAERLVVELKDKFKDEVPPGRAAANDNPPQDSRLDDVMNALITLGYQAFQAKKAVNGLIVTAGDTVQTLIKKSLGNMG